MSWKIYEKIMRLRKVSYKNDPNNELARWFFLEIDGKSFQTLYSVQNKIRIFVSDNIEIFCH